MSFGDAVASVFTNYFNFSGRARRSEYWYWTLFTMLVSFIVTRLFGGSNFGDALAGIIDIAFWIPALAVAVRRLHDIGKSGWALLFNLIPGVGQIILLVFCCRDSEGDNRFGPSPKYPAIRY